MRRLGKSDQPSAPAPSAVELYYKCPGCGLQQAYDIRRRAFLSRKPKPSRKSE
jgi:hypothetical protein